MLELFEASNALPLVLLEPGVAFLTVALVGVVKLALLLLVLPLDEPPFFDSLRIF
jgi:hypothetical protein